MYNHEWDLDLRIVKCKDFVLPSGNPLLPSALVQLTI
jgi:hypothetical protein